MVNYWEEEGGLHEENTANSGSCSFPKFLDVVSEEGLLYTS